MNLADLTDALIAALADLPEAERIDALNDVRRRLHDVSPFRDEPVDLVLWVPAGEVHANDYNPNSVAPPEMKLLALSILADGYTQPVVGYREQSGTFEVVDGFHRNRVGREVPEVRSRVRGYLPLVAINEGRIGKADRMAATIRHNRARGVHSVDGMSEIVVDLSRRKKSDAWIAENLGMEPSEVLRLKQVSGLVELFADRDFSQAWEPVEDDAPGNLDPS